MPAEDGPSFVWDENKRNANLTKHGIDFRRVAIAMSEGPFLCYRSDQKDEERYVGRIEINNQIIAVVYTDRGETIRIISARKWKAGDGRKLGELYP